MQRWGRTSTGKPRWFCKFCSKSRVQKRPDSITFWRKQLFVDWLIGTQPLGNIADNKSCTRETLSRRFSQFWNNLPIPVIPKTLFHTYLVVDAIYLAGHSECVLIGRTGNGYVFWLFARQETSVAWAEFFRKLPVPVAVVCDAQSGLLSAVKTVWPNVPLQRCLAHLQRLAISKLTRRPKTAAGQELLKLAYAAHGVKTLGDKEKWISDFDSWKARSERFLKERTNGTHPNGKNSWWYTHRRIRALKYTLEQSLHCLFAHIDHPGVPSTTNLVEGGINSRLKELLHRHRGMPLEHKKAIVAYFLDNRSRPQKPTRNVT
jgi:hypothetical protein